MGGAMSHPHREWTVLPHGKLTELEPNLLTVTGTIKMPVGDLPRRMTVVRLQDGRLVIFNAIALDDEQMSALERWGKPAFMIVPNDHHRLDARVWKLRYPQIVVIAPEGSRAKVEAEVPVDATLPDFGDSTVVFVAVPGTAAHEAALEVSAADGMTLVLNDLIGNIRDASGFSGWMLRLMGFAGSEPKIPLPVKAAIVRDKQALIAQLQHWSDLPNLKRILVSHGEPMEQDPRGVLRHLAASLH